MVSACLSFQLPIRALASPGEWSHMRHLPVQSNSNGSACADPGRQPQQRQMQDAGTQWLSPGQSRGNADPNKHASYSKA